MMSLLIVFGFVVVVVFCNLPSAIDDFKSSKFFTTSPSIRLACSCTPVNLLITRCNSFSTASHASIVFEMVWKLLFSIRTVSGCRKKSFDFFPFLAHSQWPLPLSLSRTRKHFLSRVKLQIFFFV